MRTYVLQHTQFVNQFIADMVKDIPDADMTAQPGGQVNHPAWILGHLSTGRDRLGSFLDLPPRLEPGWMQKYGFGSTPSPSRADYPSKDALLDLFLDGRAELTAAAEQIDDTRWSEPLSDDRLRALFSTLGRFTVQALIAEPMFHLGQISAWRRAMGMPNYLDKKIAEMARA